MYRFFSYKYIMYKKKYLKYKLKYLNLKKKLEGGSNTYNVFNTLEESNLDFEKLEKELNKKSNKILIVLYAPYPTIIKVNTETNIVKQYQGDRSKNSILDYFKE